MLNFSLYLYNNKMYKTFFLNKNNLRLRKKYNNELRVLIEAVVAQCKRNGCEFDFHLEEWNIFIFSLSWEDKARDVTGDGTQSIEFHHSSLNI